MSLRLTFYGGAGKVTGSNFLVEGVRGKILVDCGIEQGADAVEAHMYGPFPYDVKAIDALVVTHAHLDHVGRIPKLVKDGFHGNIYLTPPTRDLAELILRDSAAILLQDASRRGLPPLYEEKDVDAALSLCETLDYHREKEVAPGLSIFLRATGHILGSASVRIKDLPAQAGEESIAIALTGDIGNSPSPLLPDWEPVHDADALVMESVYGDRVHPHRTKRDLLLKEKLQAAVRRGGTILIPAFSLERTQLMLYELSNLFDAGDLPKIPVFLDSPLAIHVTAVYEKWGPTYFKPAAEAEMRREGSLFDFPFLTKTSSHRDSGKIAETPGPKIIIAGAGMSHGGRIGGWEARYLPDPSTTLFIVGYQVPGSPGRRIADGASSVRLNGAEVPIRAHVEKVDGWSAHADRDELLSFAQASLPRLKTVFTAMGEPVAERFLAQRIHEYLSTRAIAAQFADTWEIMKDSTRRVENSGRGDRTYRATSPAS